MNLSCGFLTWVSLWREWEEFNFLKNFSNNKKVIKGKRKVSKSVLSSAFALEDRRYRAVRDHLKCYCVGFGL